MMHHYLSSRLFAIKALLRLWLTIFLLAPGFILAQVKEYQALIDRERMLKHIKNDSLRSEELKELCWQFMYLDTVKYHSYQNQYLELIQKRKDTLGLGLVYYMKAYKSYYSKNYQQASELARKAMQYTNGRDNFFFIEVAQVLMRSLHYTNRLEEAERVGLQIIRRKELANLPLQLAKIYYNLGLISMNGMKDSSVTYLYKAISLLSKEPNNKLLLPVQHYISTYYRDKNSLDSAFKYATLSYQLTKDSINYNNVDFISPANNYQQLLAHLGQHQEAQEVSRELQIRQYDLKVKSIIYPEVSKQVDYLEYLRANQRIRFITLLFVTFSILIILSFFIFFYTKLKKKQLALTESLNLNQTLMRETNHRVKNNFQIMLSMLNLNYNYSSNSMDNFVEQVKARIASMAKAHDIFLQNAGSSTTEVQNFFKEVLDTLEGSLNLKDKKISIHFTSSQQTLKTNKIITLGLIINELVVNAVKYAFSGQEGGKIELCLDQINDEYIMTFRDNGVGMDLKNKQHHGEGMAIIYSLAKQLKGQARVINSSGTVVEVAFKV